MAAGTQWFLIVLLICLVKRLDGEVLCEPGFCRTYTLDVGCPSTAQHCRINNDTHTGLTLLSPTICNCCEYCLPFLGENEHCSLGGAGAGTTIGRCGDGLTCTPGVDGNFCKKMTSEQSECHRKQDDYDMRYAMGETGSLEERPMCDGKGMFASFACVPTQTCFCQSEDGERLFGEVAYQGSVTLQNMHCGCSRFNHKIQTSINPGIPYPVVGPRCTSDGNFNPVQCLNTTCYCVNRITGVRQGDNHVDLTEDPISKLPCYDPDLDLFSQYELDEPPFNFTSPCLRGMAQKIDLMKQSEEDGFDVEYFSEVSECLPDGTYGRVAKTMNGTKICVDEWGHQIEHYEAKPNSPEYTAMDCKCAVTSLLLSSSQEKPVCCKNGNFRPVQCRRGACRCVDTDGKQYARETTDVASLPCYTEDWRSC